MTLSLVLLNSVVHVPRAFSAGFCVFFSVFICIVCYVSVSVYLVLRVRFYY